MASADEDQDISGRRTRSGRKVSAHALSSIPRTTRRSSRKHVEEQLAENDTPSIIPEDEPNVYCFEESDEQHITGHSSAGIQQSNIIRKIVPVTTQDVISDSGPDYFNESTVEQVIEEQLQDECVFYEEVHLHEEDQQQLIEEDVEMYTLHEDEHNDTTEVPIASVSETGVDEKSSSFPFGTVGQSETSEDVHNEEEEEEEASEEINETGAVESSLMASLAGDNANSLPSVGGGEESESNKKEDFEAKAVEPIQPNCETLDSDDDSLSNPAIAEDILGDGGGADASDATIVNMEMVSEDELPLPVKPEINDAEEVSDDELPAPQRAELPADAEVISEDELPVASANDKKSPDSSPNHDETANSPDTTVADGGGFGGGQKRKADENTAQPVASETKKKSNDEQYNPMSPTSESNDGLPPPPEKKAKIDGPDIEQKEKKRDKEKEKEKDRKRLPDLDKYWRAVKDDPADFTGWTYLLQYVDNETDAEAAREAYDAFLAHYPYCYGYWRKYADFEKRKGIKSNCNAVFERGLEAIPLSVDLWIHYLTHVKSTHGDNEDYIRSQFERAISACGLEFRSDKLWDAYIKWENDGKRYKRVFSIYDRLLAIPTQGYSGHFDNFQDLITQHSIISTVSSDEIIKIRMELHELTSLRPAAALRASKSRRESNSKERELHDEKKGDELTDKSHGPAATGGTIEAPVAAVCDAAKLNKLLEINDLGTLNDEEILSIKDKVISVRRKLHKSTVAAVTARWTFEEAIKRPYFHVKPLERSQLKNWKDYLDFEIEMGDRKRILVLFERCLIACALYDEFWLKMIRYLETQLVGMEAHPESKIAAITSDVFRRACDIHHPDKPSLHLMWAAFEECMGKFDCAAEILVKLEQKCPNILQVAYRRINVERRRGDLAKCRELYEHYVNVAKNKTIAGSLAIKYARFLNKQCNDLDGGLRVLRQALDRDGANTRVALQMIDLALQRPKVDEEEVVMIMNRFMARESIDPEQKVLFAQRKVEFLEDFGSTARGLQDAQRSLQLALGKANEAKKKRESSPNRKTGGAKDSGAMSGASTQSNYNNGGSATTNPYYNSGNSTYAAYGQTTGGAYQQQQQPYDGYYNHWQYGSTAGYGGYNQWSGYGNYY